jgi:hypothetical protein
MPRAPQATERPKADYAVQSVENALDLLDAICEEGGEARISQLSQRLGMSKTSVFRLLATFEGRGFVERSDDSLKYRLGLSACEMGQKILARMGVLRKARPAMNRLVRQCNESVYFVVRRNDYVLMLDMVDTTHQVKITPLVGQRFPLSTAPGRIFLAFEGEGGEEARRSAGGGGPGAGRTRDDPHARSLCRSGGLWRRRDLPGDAAVQHQGRGGGGPGHPWAGVPDGCPPHRNRTAAAVAGSRGGDFGRARLPGGLLQANSVS